MRVLISDQLSQHGIDILVKDPEIEVDVEPRMTDAEVLECIGDYDGLIIRSRTHVSKGMIDRAKRLRVIGRAGVGVDNIDMSAATARGILVVNAPTGNTISAAELTITMLLALSRKITAADASVRRGEWTRSRFIGVEVRNKLLAVVGLGKVGTEVARQARGLGMKVIGVDPYVAEESAQKQGIRLVTFDEALETADYLTLHLTLNRETYHMLGKEQFARMKPGARLINCARGGLCDETAIVEALESGRLAGAALDVFENEPIPPDHPFRMLESVVLTPHVGASTEEAQANVAIEIAEQVQNALHGRSVATSVNLPPIEQHKLELFGPYMRLAERIGKLQAQLVNHQMNRIDIHYAGELFSEGVTPITVALQKGILTPALGDSVNYVNAPYLLKQRGIRTTESKTLGHNFVSSIRVTVHQGDISRTIEATVFGEDDARIMWIDDYHVNAVPRGNMMIIYNQDQPGAIGLMGTILGRNGINVSDMSVGRVAIRERAIMVLNVDSPVPKNVLNEILAEEMIESVQLAEL